MDYKSKAVDRFFNAVLSLKNAEECHKFFEDVCTIKEIVEISQRLEVACMLTEKKSFQTINEETGVSSATIGRVNRCLNYGAGGYKLAIERINEQKEEN